jgi:hypothetical protein
MKMNAKTPSGRGFQENRPSQDPGDTLIWQRCIDLKRLLFVVRLFRWTAGCLKTPDNSGEQVNWGVGRWA